MRSAGESRLPVQKRVVAEPCRRSYSHGEHEMDLESPCKPTNRRDCSRTLNRHEAVGHASFWVAKPLILCVCAHALAGSRMCFCVVCYNCGAFES